MNLRDLPYSVRISKLNDDTLELRRLKLDLVMVYKVVHNLVNLNFEDLFHINRGRITRGHKLRLLRENSKVLARSNNFCCRPLKIWNSLDASVAEAKSLYVFKSLLNTVNFEKCLLVRDWIILCLFNCIIVFKIVIVIVLNFSFTFTVFYYIILSWIGELWASYDLSLLWHSSYIYFIFYRLHTLNFMWWLCQ